MSLELLIHIVLIIMTTFFLSYIMINSKKSRILLINCLLYVFYILISIADFCSGLAPDDRTRWICVAVTYLIKPYSDVLFLFYIRKEFHSKTARTATFFFSFFYIAVVDLLILTNPIHHFVFREITTKRVVYAPAYYVCLTTGFLLTAAGMFAIVKYRVTKLANRTFRLLGAMLVLVITLCTHLSLLSIVNFVVNPFQLIIMFCFASLFYGTCKLGMVDTISNVSKRGFVMFVDAILIVDRKGTVQFKNEIAKSISEQTIKKITEEFLQKLYEGHQEVSEDICIMEDKGTKHYSVSAKRIRTSPLMREKFLLILHDTTELISGIEKLSEKNRFLLEMHENIKTLSENSKKLAIMEKRNDLAKEIHDVMGHSLILALNTMESNRQMHIDREIALQRIKKAVTEIHGSIDEIMGKQSESVCHTKQRKLHDRLHTLAKNMTSAGLLLEVTTFDSLASCDETTCNELFRICQEASTNSMKHGKATSVTISIKKKEAEIELFIVDNGIGCSCITKGNGLRGMEDRIRRLHGKISFRSFEDGKGFLVLASIPAAGSAE